MLKKIIVCAVFFLFSSNTLFAQGEKIIKASDDTVKKYIRLRLFLMEKAMDECLSPREKAIDEAIEECLSFRQKAIDEAINEMMAQQENEEEYAIGKSLSAGKQSGFFLTPYPEAYLSAAA